VVVEGAKQFDRELPGPRAAQRTDCPFARVRDRLRAVGLRPTRQRISLGWILFGAGDRHVTAEMIFEEARRARVPVSLATVYNTLHQFTSVGLLRQIAIDATRTYYDTNPTHHHHFAMEGGDALVDVPSDKITIGRLPEPPEGYEIAQVDVVVHLRRRSPRNDGAPT
jgi:Fur family iron response transcriptional regulator